MSVYIKQEPGMHADVAIAAVAAIPIRTSPATSIKQEPGLSATTVTYIPIHPEPMAIKSEPGLRQTATPSPSPPRPAGPSNSLFSSAYATPIASTGLSQFQIDCQESRKRLFADDDDDDTNDNQTVKTEGRPIKRMRYHLHTTPIKPSEEPPTPTLPSNPNPRDPRVDLLQVCAPKGNFTPYELEQYNAVQPMVDSIVYQKAMASFNLLKEIEGRIRNEPPRCYGLSSTQREGIAKLQRIMDTGVIPPPDKEGEGKGKSAKKFANGVRRNRRGGRKHGNKGKQWVKREPGS
ncbi:hypothetical protein PTTW11_09508 [Pyrenophora teres f. teres]|uniref:Uncharacterized protein n=1 Tax=Pyrenophora teres f. teres TaxID=97479 RepID=A0A6S6WDG8_9PLEO|nr:hypothetical protein PTTW11_09508 [Pyrenophora teres f. teres]